MDFGRILEQWEGKKKRKKEKQDISRWLELYPPENEMERKDFAEDTNPRLLAAENRKKLRAMLPQRVLDLHGLISREAADRVIQFISQCHAQGLRKILIIHGKGKHSKEGPVLGNRIRKVIENSPLAGEYGEADRDLGGSGATWVILR
ncbi:MAG TPA: Smr/MutS family protein [Spirochaetia bacterium]|nr:Smr/MutS family protein [Spirochaetia bacterium]